MQPYPAIDMKMEDVSACARKFLKILPYILLSIQRRLQLSGRKKATFLFYIW